jgi:hypothetical protein
MKEQEVIINNRLIADFILPSIEWKDSRKGKIRLYAKPRHNTPHCQDYELDYDSNWNWLMAVVEKIEDECLMNVIIENSAVTIEGRCINGAFYSKQTSWQIQYGTKIDMTNKAVVEFIKWYNQTNR